MATSGLQCTPMTSTIAFHPPTSTVYYSTQHTTELMHSVLLQSVEPHSNLTSLTPIYVVRYALYLHVGTGRWQGSIFTSYKDTR